MKSASNPKVQSIDVEVLPPDHTQGSSHDKSAATSNALPRLIAFFMDDLIKLPGTNRRLGLNPFLDLLPVFGDGMAAVISATTLYVASRSGVPKVVLARMGLNILLNSVMGVIPGVGEVFAFWFRPNHRNYELLQKHSIASANRKPSTRNDWFFVAALIAATSIVFGLCIATGAYLFILLLHAINAKSS